MFNALFLFLYAVFFYLTLVWFHFGFYSVFDTVLVHRVWLFVMCSVSSSVLVHLMQIIDQLTMTPGNKSVFMAILETDFPWSMRTRIGLILSTVHFFVFLVVVVLLLSLLWSRCLLLLLLLFVQSFIRPGFVLCAIALFTYHLHFNLRSQLYDRSINILSASILFYSIGFWSSDG